jgi:hypothetical protein
VDGARIWRGYSQHRYEIMPPGLERRLPAQPRFPGSIGSQAMGLESSARETPTATFAELEAFRTKAIEMGLQSLATAALIGWEGLQRARSTSLRRSRSRTIGRKTDQISFASSTQTCEENWIPLVDAKTGVGPHSS